MISDITKSSFDAAIFISENTQIVNEPKNFNDYYFSSVDYLSGKLLCDNLGKEIFQDYKKENDEKNKQKILREIICKFFKKNKPNSLLALPYGPTHFFERLSGDFNQILDYANLTSISEDNPDDEIIDWWDDLIDFARSLIDKKKIESGRSGEKKSLEFEKKKLKNLKINLKPTWDGFWDNKLGYDIKSFDKHKNNIFIEAKSSKDKRGIFFLTKNEWKCASSEKTNYFIHLWIQEDPKPIIIEYEELKLRVLRFQEISNEGEQWESIKINYSVKTN